MKQLREFTALLVNAIFPRGRHRYSLASRVILKLTPINSGFRGVVNKKPLILIGSLIDEPRRQPRSGQQNSQVAPKKRIAVNEKRCSGALDRQ